MNVSEWNDRYRVQEQSADLKIDPTPLLVEAVQHLPIGRALDLACGSGRNALWLAERGWFTQAVDGSEAAIKLLQEQAQKMGLEVATEVADLTKAEFLMGEAQWDLILMSYYLQRNLFDSIKKAAKPGGTIVAIVHTTYPGEEATAHRVEPGELARYFIDWPVVHYYEGASRDPAHRRPVAEIVAQRPFAAV